MCKAMEAGAGQRSVIAMMMTMMRSMLAMPTTMMMPIRDIMMTMMTIELVLQI